ncbi:MAG TPA: class I tRNA ligase family protein, partial [Longimicrobiales bacterium]|nr:class I tRNA ligase family protein [Longimicrobiales bacterium]
QGPYGFLSRVWDSLNGELGDGPPADETKLNATIKKVTDDLENLQYNTAIAALMEYLNVVRHGNRVPNRREVEPLIPLVAPFAPHLAEELWEMLGHKESIFAGNNWPTYDPSKLVADTVEFIVQVNGKVRARLPMPRGITQDAAQASALADENVGKFINGDKVSKVVFVPDRLINLVL